MESICGPLCGLDVHKRSISACIRISEPEEKHTVTATFRTFTPGVDFTTAAVILAEIGLDMSRFADAAHLASWAGLCSGNNESGGKRYSGSTRKGNRYLRRVLTQSAWSLKRKKDCYLSALFWRVSSRGGSKKAALAVAHRILIIAYQSFGTAPCTKSWAVITTIAFIAIAAHGD